MNFQRWGSLVMAHNDQRRHAAVALSVPSADTKADLFYFAEDNICSPIELRQLITEVDYRVLPQYRDSPDSYRDLKDSLGESLDNFIFSRRYFKVE
jgi:hypothetical protein